MKQRYTIGNDDGKTTTILIDGHRQHIWNESHASVSFAVKRRVVRELGDGPYTNPCGNFGQAQRVYVHAE